MKPLKKLNNRGETLVESVISFMMFLMILTTITGMVLLSNKIVARVSGIRAERIAKEEAILKGTGTSQSVELELSFYIAGAIGGETQTVYDGAMIVTPDGFAYLSD